MISEKTEWGLVEDDYDMMTNELSGVDDNMVWVEMGNSSIVTMTDTKEVGDEEAYMHHLSNVSTHSP